MALPSIGGGSQVGDGNVAEAVLIVQGDPGAATSTVTLTTAQLLSGLIVANPSTTAAAYTLPTAALMDAAVANGQAKVNQAFVCQFINLGTSTGVVTLTAGTGWTLVGRAAVPITTGAHLIARKTGVAAWTLYIVG